VITLISNYLEGKYATPKNHPTTCANPAPWKIIQMKIEREDSDTTVRILIRGEGSLWFRADQCWIETKEDLIEQGKFKE
jgi:hypothetical protein